MSAVWIQLDPAFPMDGLGWLVDLLDDGDQRPVRAQLEDRYAHGGGWRPIRGFTMDRDKVLHFPEDEPYTPSAMTRIGKEWVIFYRQCSLLAVIQPTGEFAVTRVD
jgi:hypothetical protein